MSDQETRLREAIRYALGYDVAGWPSHLRPATVEARVEAALVDLLAALRAAEEENAKLEAALRVSLDGVISELAAAGGTQQPNVAEFRPGCCDRLRTLRATHKSVSWGAIAEELADELVRVEAARDVAVKALRKMEQKAADEEADPEALLETIWATAERVLASLSAADTEPGGER